MKKFTKKLLKSGTPKCDLSIDHIFSNSEKANKKLGIPKKLYLELSDKFPRSKLKKDCDNSDSKNNYFIAGFIIGWAEKNENIN